jgi:hypothetical protein
MSGLLQSTIVFPPVAGKIIVRYCNVLLDHTLRIMDMEKLQLGLILAHDLTGHEPNRIGLVGHSVMRLSVVF